MPKEKIDIFLEDIENHNFLDIIHESYGDDSEGKVPIRCRACGKKPTRKGQNFCGRCGTATKYVTPEEMKLENKKMTSSFKHFGMGLLKSGKIINPELSQTLMFALANNNLDAIDIDTGKLEMKFDGDDEFIAKIKGKSKENDNKPEDNPNEKIYKQTRNAALDTAREKLNASVKKAESEGNVALANLLRDKISDLK